ncbi:MAG: adenosine deaminase [Anaerolineaceae bacterium]|nr:adenosine deaminase [Anaerolineaceae bacterium]
MTLTEFIKAMPKVELHVHLEGATQPETLLKLARKHHVMLPADTVDGLREWFAFRDFSHFIEVYIKISECMRTPEDIELLTREFLQGQAAQNILHSEVTYTPYTHYKFKGLAFEDQLAAINRARAWAEAELGVTMGLIIDISRNVTPEEGLVTAEWAIKHRDNGVIALGLGGPENGHPPEKHAEAFQRAHDAGVTCILHAGELAGAESIRGALTVGHSVRIGHGVRCLEDPALVAELREIQIPLEVCPTSNVCLRVVPSLAEHPLPRLVEAGLYVTINSDDPPMFNTTLTDEYLQAAAHFGFDVDRMEKFALDALWAARLPEYRKASLSTRFRAEFQALRRDLMGWPFRESQD